MNPLVKFENHHGQTVFIDPRAVTAIAPSVIDGCSAVWLYATPEVTLTVRGIPTEVHAKLFQEAR